MEKLTDKIAEWLGRLRFPLVRSFLIYWVIVNWEPISIYCFSSKQMEARICAIYAFNLGWWELLWLPLILGLVSLLVIYWTALGVDWILQYPEQKRRINKVKRDQEFIETKTELETSKQRLLEQQAHVEELEKARSETTKAQSSLTAATNEIVNLERQLSNTTTRHSDTVSNVAHLLYEKKLHNLFDFLPTGIKDKIIQLAVQELKDTGLTDDFMIYSSRMKSRSSNAKKNYLIENPDVINAFVEQGLVDENNRHVTSSLGKQVEKVIN